MTEKKYSFDKAIDRQNTGACKWLHVGKPVKSLGLIPYTIADMELEIAPEIKNALMRSVQHGICGYTMADDTYFEAVASYMKRRHNYIVKEDELCTTFGVVAALGIAVRAFTNEGDGIIIQTPVYPPFFNVIRDNGRTLLENRLINNNGHFEMDFDGLETLMREQHPKMIILCSPHNPVGRVWTRTELIKLGDLCEKYDVIVISDEIHSDIVQPGYTHTVFAALPRMNERTVTCTAMSKTFNLAGLMCSNIFISNRELYAKFERRVGLDGSDCIPYFGRAAALSAFTECDEWIDELNCFIGENHALCESFFAEHLPMLKRSSAEGTYLEWIDFSALGMSDKELQAFLLEKAHLALSCGADFGDCGKQHIRMNIAVPRAELETALCRLRDAINTYVG